jgi:O-antigen ligase
MSFTLYPHVNLKTQDAVLVIYISFVSSIFMFCVMYYSLFVAVVIGVLIVIILLLLKTPRYSLYTIIFLSPYYFMSHSLLSSGVIGITTRYNPIDFLSVILITGIFINILYDPPSSLNITTLDSLFILWLLISIGGFFHGYIRGYEAVFRSSRGPLLFVLYFAVVREINTFNRLKELSTVLLLSSVVMGFVGIFGAIGILTPFFPNLPVGIVAEIFTRPNFFVDPALSIANIVFLISLLLLYEFNYTGYKFLLFLGLILNIAIIMLSVTRGFWAGMFVSILTMGIILYRKQYCSIRRLLFSLIFIIILFIIIQMSFSFITDVNLLLASIERFVSALLRDDPQSISLRFDEFIAYYESFLKSPIYGNGYGSPIVFDYTSNLGFSHNQYVWILETTGIIGFFSYCLLIINGTREIYDITVNPKDSGLQCCYQVFCVSIVIGFVVTSLSSPEFTNPTTVPLLVTIFGSNRALSCRQ